MRFFISLQDAFVYVNNFSSCSNVTLTSYAISFDSLQKHDRLEPDNTIVI